MEKGKSSLRRQCELLALNRSSLYYEADAKRWIRFIWIFRAMGAGGWVGSSDDVDIEWGGSR